MDVNEYLRLMRLHREDDLDTVRQVFLRRRNNNGRLPLECLHEALKECKCCPSHCDVFAEIYEGASNSSLHDLSLAELQIFADKCTKAVKQVQKQRQRAPVKPKAAIIQGVTEAQRHSARRARLNVQVKRRPREAGQLRDAGVDVDRR